MIYWIAASIGVVIGFLFGVIWLSSLHARCHTTFIHTLTDMVSAILHQPNVTQEQWKYWENVSSPAGKMVRDCKEIADR